MPETPEVYPLRVNVVVPLLQTEVEEGEMVPAVGVPLQAVCALTLIDKNKKKLKVRN